MAVNISHGKHLTYLELNEARQKSFALRQIVSHTCHENALFSKTCRIQKKIWCKIKYLILCLNFRQIVEMPRKQGKFRDRRSLSAELSTGFVDSLVLELGCATVKQTGESRKG